MRLKPHSSNSNLHFCISTLEVRDGKKLKAITPDKDGYYCNFPVAVLGAPSRSGHGMSYDPESAIAAMSNPKMPFFLRLQDGSLYGERGHPTIPENMNRKDKIRRILSIESKNLSHHFRKIAAAETLENGGVVIRADIKPYGTYGKDLEEQFLDPNMNVSFSLRAMADARRVGATMRRFIKHFVTFDSETIGGFDETSKRFVDGFSVTENLNMDVDLVDFYDENEESGYVSECLVSDQLLEIFGAEEVKLYEQSLGHRFGNTGTFIDKSGERKSIFHAYQKIKMNR